MSEQDWFTEAFAPAAAEESSAAESVIETAAPETDVAPPVVDAVATPDPTPSPAPDPVAQAVPEAPAVQWESPDNPFYEDGLLARQIKQAAAEAKRLREQTEFQNKLTELADGDSDRLQELNGLLAQQTAPITQQLQAFQERANGSEKTLAAFVIAAKAHLTDEQIETLMSETKELMTLDGADVMERTAFGKRDFKRQFESTLSAKDAEIAALRQQLASQGQLSSREASGADLVDGGTGAPPDMTLDDRLRAAPDLDAYFAILNEGNRAA